MIADLRTERTIRRAIERGGYLRRATSRLSDVGAHKEWVHFCISATELDVFVNFSLVDDVRPSAEPGAEIARLTCAVRTDQWDGDVDHFETTEVHARAGRMGLRFGDNFVRYSAGSFHVVAALKGRDIEVDLSLRPVTVPSQVNNIALGDAPPLHWFVVPRLLATGTVRVGRHRVHLENVPAYHDHNWGYFKWGQNFSWVWGYAHGHSAASPWGMAFDRLSNRARNIDLVRGMLLWKGARHHRVFGGSDVVFRSEGLMRPDSVLKLPRVMALLRPGLAVDLPKKFIGRAESRGDVLEFEFEGKHVCQLIAPNEDDLDVTVINEVSGDFALAGNVRGERVSLDGRAMFEFLGG